MSPLPLAICLALAWFLAVNALASCAVVLACWRARRPWADGRFALVLRLLPAVAAALFAALVFVPGFLLYEPARGPEPVGWSIVAAAGAALGVWTAAMARAVARWRHLRALVRGWEATATPLAIDPRSDGALVALAVDDRFPVMALVGLWRPRLFIARQVLDALSAGELRAAIAHELAHGRARDNVKRLLVSGCPDVLGWFGAGRRLEQQWAAAAERAADRSAAASSRARGVDLAGALVKVSRMASTPVGELVLFSTLHERGDIAERVSRLIHPGEADGRSPRGLVAALGLLAAGAGSLPVTWPAVHSLTETCLRLLP